MKIATLDLTAQLLAEFAFAGTYHNGIPGKFFIKKNPLPDDVRVLSVAGTETPGVVRLVLGSDIFADVPEGQEPPSVPPIIYQTIYDTN